MTTLNNRIRDFIDQLSENPAEDRVVEYIVREVHNGRSLMDVIKDPYVRNRLSDEKVDKVLQNPEVAEALEQEIAETFRNKPEIGFGE